MGKSSAPPLARGVVRTARLSKFMSQSDVLRALAERGIEIDPGTYSRIENSRTRWPALRIIPALADVLGLKPEDMFETEQKAA